MDTAQYLPMFLAEAREHIQELNIAVVRVEEAPDDFETVNEIFRIAHSLKGMSATMGFEAMASLTHNMEDVFELLKQRRGGLDRAAIDVLLECIDTLEAAVDGIETDGSEHLDPAELNVRLQALVRAPDEGVREAARTRRPELTAVIDAADGRRVVHIVVTLTDDSLMPSVREVMALCALAVHGEILASVPPVDDVDGFDLRVVEAWLASDHEDDVVVAAAAAVPDVAGATLTEFDVTAAADEPQPAPAAVAAQADEPVAEADQPAAVADVPPPHRKAAATVRVDAERLDQLMHYMGELVVHRTLVESLAATADVPGLPQAMQELTRSSQALQAMVMQVRMIPVDAVFMRFPRLVRDLSGKLDKEVELRLVGKDTELDRTVVEALGDPLVHLVRNSLDHGLEHPADRVKAGKPSVGVLEIAARHAGGNVVIEVRDDGKGIDPELVGRRAVERGLIAPEVAATLDVAKAVELLFAPGFSTAESATDISGRGVGMDAVRTTIRELGGEVTMTSEKGKGTMAQIRLPLTLAIMAALLVECGGQPYAIPLDRVERTLRLSEQTVRSVAGQRMLVLRDGVLPVLDGAAALGGAPGAEAADAVIVRGQDRRLALSVSDLVGQRELVTRPLPSHVADRAAVSGGAVLSDGRIALIVDCDALDFGGADRAPRIAA